MRSNCEVATGFVTATSLEHDGDLVIDIAPDDRFTRLLCAGNQRIGNHLVVEVPCQGPIDQKNALGACDHRNIPVVPQPAVGSHIIAAAHWVQDRNHHMWGELHGARILVLPR
jgi:hypothetical protein